MKTIFTILCIALSIAFYCAFNLDQKEQLKKTLELKAFYERAAIEQPAK